MANADQRDRLGRASRYIDGTAGEGLTDRLNHDAWDRWSILPRVLRDLTMVDASTKLFGVRLDVPIIVAPWQNHRLAHPDGEIGTAMAARASGVGFALSMGSSQLIEEVAAVSGPYLQQLYVPRNRESMKPFVERCVAAGAYAFAVTVDSPPLGVAFGFRADVADSHRQNLPNFENGALGSTRDLVGEDVAWLRGFSGLPVLAKGVLRADDARMAVAAGAAGVIVSNHGGRQLEGSIATAEVLPEVVDAVGDAGIVLVDGGIRRSEDVLRALSLGAAAVLVGRPAARALLYGGPAEVERLMSELAEGFRRQLVLSGARSVSELNSSFVRWRTWG